MSMTENSSVVKSVVEQSSTLDRNQALEHLAALGFERGNTIYMRYIHPVTKRSIKKSKFSPKQAEDFQKQGFDVYFVANGGGDTDANVKVCRAIFYEHDDLPKSEQLVLWQKLGLPVPTFQVDTGGKSLHSYWVFDRPIAVEKWSELQSDLLKYSGGDRSIKNPSRVMRLAGSLYMKGDRPGSTIATIISNSGEKYSYEQLIAAIPQKATIPVVKMVDELVTDAVPLYQFLTKDDRNLIDRGAGEGSRNSSGAKLARNLIGTVARLNYLGVNFEGEPRSLFDDFYNRCSPPLDGKEAGAIWKSAEKDNPTASLTDDVLKNCASSWHRQQQLLRRNYISANNVIQLPASKKLSDDGVELKKTIDVLIDKALSPFELTATISSLVKEHGCGDKVVWQLYRERLKEIERSESREEVANTVAQLIEANESALDISQIIPYDLAAPLKQLAGWLNLRPECYLTALLATVSSLHDVGTKLTLLEKTDFDVTPNLFAAIVAESSQKKSPIFKAMVTKPLGILRSVAASQYEQEMFAYNQAWEEYSELDKEERKKEFPDGPPQEPKRRIYSFTHTTGEGLLAQVKNHPDKGLLWETDELAGALKSANSYRQGRGSDEEDLLSFYDGTGATVLRAGGVRADLQGLSLGIVGTIQPAVLEKLAGDGKDVNGKWARFMFVHQPVSACEILDDSGSLDLTPRLADLYQKIDKLPKAAYKLTPDAKQYFISIRNKIDLKRVGDPNPAMRAVWGKTEGRIGKIAINLHVIAELMAGRTPGEYIPKGVIVAAARLAKFYAHQIQSIYYQFDNEDNENLAPNLVKVVELALKKGWIKARDVQLSTTAKKRPDSATVRGWFDELVHMGKGEIRGSGRKIEFSVVNVDESRQNVDTSTTNVSPIPPCLQPFVVNVDEEDTPDNSFSLEKVDTPLAEEIQGSTKSTGVDFASTKSTLTTNGQDLDPASYTVVDHPTTIVSTSSTESIFQVGDRVAGFRFNSVLGDTSNPDWFSGGTLIKRLDSDKWTIQLSEQDGGSTISCSENDFDLEPVEAVA